MAVRIPWDQYETSLLIDAYIKVCNNELERKEAVKNLSDLLRKYALRIGMEIDDIYRNENGISLQMKAIEELFGIHTSLGKNHSKLFEEMVELYKNDKPTFMKILNRAELKYGVQCLDETFFLWVKNRTTLTESELSKSFEIINNYCKSKKSINKSIFEILDVNIVKKIYNDITTNIKFRIFNFINYEKIKKTLNLYMSFIKEFNGFIKSNPYIKTKEEEYCINLKNKIDNDTDNEKLIVEDSNISNNHSEEKLKLYKQLLNSLNYIIKIKEYENKKKEAPKQDLQNKLPCLKDKVSIEDKVYLLLKSISKDNPYGTTSFYLANEIKIPIKVVENILNKAEWATMEYKRYKFNENINEINNEMVINFNDLPSLTYTKPIKFNYFDETKKDVSSWRELLLELMKVIYEDYPDKFKDLVSDLKSHLIVSEENKSLLHTPGYISDSLWVELNRSAPNIVRFIKQILIKCNVDFENVIIYYTRKDDISLINNTKTEIEKDTCNNNEKDVLNKSTPISSVKYTNFNTNSLIDDFRSWLHNEKNLAIPTANDYSSAITNCEQIMAKLGISEYYLYGTDYDNAKRLINILRNTTQFYEANKIQHNRLNAALKKYIEFLSYQDNVSTNNIFNNSEKESQSQELDNSLDDYKKILSENFPRGFRINSTLDAKKFIRYYNEMNGTEWDKNDENIQNSIRNKINKAGIKHGEYVFTVDSLLTDATKIELINYIENSFEQGTKVIYYRALFQLFNDKFLENTENRIYDEEMLRTYLIHVLYKKYAFQKTYISKSWDITSDPKEEIINLFANQGSPMQIINISSKLPHLPKDKIEFILHSNSEFINNSLGEYFHISLIDMNKNDLKKISMIIQNEIDHYHFVSGNELIALINKHNPEILENFSQFSELGLRNTIAYLLKSQFSFNGNIISSIDKPLSMTDVFAEFAKNRTSFTLDELVHLKKNMNCTIYFDAVYNNSLRISQDQFVSKDQACFDIEQTDKAISDYCTGDYIPISQITMFGTFPYAGFPWTIYLLEHYVAHYSNEYKLLHTGFNEKSCLGAIVKKNSNIQSFNDLLIKVFSDYNQKLTKEEALQYLYEQGYIGARRFADIDAILLKAEAKKGR